MTVIRKAGVSDLDEILRLNKALFDFEVNLIMNTILIGHIQRQEGVIFKNALKVNRRLF